MWLIIANANSISASLLLLSLHNGLIVSHPQENDDATVDDLEAICKGRRLTCSARMRHPIHNANETEGTSSCLEIDLILWFRLG